MAQSSFPCLDTEASNIELINQYADQFNHLGVLDYSSFNHFQGYMPFSSDNFFGNSCQGPEFPGSLIENFPAGFVQQNSSSNINKNKNNNLQNEEASASQCLTMAGNPETKESKTRISMEMSESSSGVSNPPVPQAAGIKRKNSSGRGKRVKTSSEEEDEKPKEVVHVRARRGQATDSHSLAERVRRGKINERLRCLQDIVPGCSKTKGMAVLLDEIINYVQSLQNQVEFLSMRLTAASSFYDFNSDIEDTMETMQQRAKELERVKIEAGYGGVVDSSFQYTSTNYWSL